MRKTFCFLASFSIGLACGVYVQTIDWVTVYLYYRIHGPQALRALEDFLVFHPIASLGILLQIGAIVYLVRLHVQLENEKEELRQKGF